MNAPAGGSGLPAEDRLARDDMIQATLAFMRGEIDNDGMDQRIERYNSWHYPKATVRLPEDFLWCQYSHLGPETINPHPEAWDSFRRILAFLKTDRPLRPETVRVRDWRRWVALAALGVLAAAAALAWARGRFEYLAVPWIALGMVWVFIEPHPGCPQEVTDQARYQPFRDRAEWEAHEPLLRNLDVPTYALHTDAQLGHVPLNTWWSDLDWSIITVLAVPVLLLMALRSPSWKLAFAAPTPDATDPPGPCPCDAGVRPAGRRPDAPPSAT